VDWDALFVEPSSRALLARRNEAGEGELVEAMPSGDALVPPIESPPE
jgi:hypothetical protein